MAVLSYMPFCALAAPAFCPTYVKNDTNHIVRADIFYTYKVFQQSVIDLICTLIIFIYIYSITVYIKRVKSLNINQAKYIREAKMLAQGSVCSLSLCIVGLQMFLGPTTVPPNVTKVFHTMYSGLNPIIYLTLDPNLRKGLLQTIGRRPKLDSVHSFKIQQDIQLHNHNNR